MLKKLILPIIFLLGLASVTQPMEDFSRSKQQKYFPKELKKKDVYLGMPLEKFRKEAPKASPINTDSEFKIEYTEDVSKGAIVAYHYLLTKETTPRVYKIAIEYKTMEGVQAGAEQLLGAPNYNNEWRLTPKEVKEEFAMGIWTFGHKLVYGATIKNSEWGKGIRKLIS